MGRQHEQFVIKQFEQLASFIILVRRFLRAAVDPEPGIIRRFQQQTNAIAVGSRPGANCSARRQPGAIADTADQFWRFQCWLSATHISAERSISGAEGVCLRHPRQS